MSGGRAGARARAGERTARSEICPRARQSVLHIHTHLPHICIHTYTCQTAKSLSNYYYYYVIYMIHLYYYL